MNSPLTIVARGFSPSDNVVLATFGSPGFQNIAAPYYPA